METTLRTPGLLDQLFYYMFSEYESCSIVLNVRLKMAVSPTKLTAALRLALMRNASFREMPVIDREGRLKLMANPIPAEVYPYDPAPVNYGTTDTNYYMFRLMYRDREIILSAFHGLTDGRGIMMFARTLLYYYFEAFGISINPGDKVLTLDTPEDPTEMVDSMRHFANSGADKPPERKAEQVFRLPMEPYPVDTSGRDHRFRICFETESLMKIARAAGTTFTPVFSALVARAVYRTFDTKGRTISMLGAVDERPFYGSKSLLNFTELYRVPFIPALCEADLEIQARIIKDDVMARQITKERFDQRLYEELQAREILFSPPLTNTNHLTTLRRQLWKDEAFYATFFVTNVGTTDLPEEMNGLIESADIFVSNLNAHPYFVVLTHGDLTIVNVVQRFPGDFLARRVYETLVDAGVKAAFEDSGMWRYDKFFVRNLRRI
ncbi:MAG: hypothetical protein IJP92_10720 [Lachnospiraceae bacterium]|nr:hypothetical protein [Lachnospiraceae bacterium]